MEERIAVRWVNPGIYVGLSNKKVSRGRPGGTRFSPVWTWWSRFGRYPNARAPTEGVDTFRNEAEMGEAEMGMGEAEDEMDKDEQRGCG